MIYEPGTILVRKEQREPDEDGNEYAYNRVRVIGQSPISHAGGAISGWQGAEAQGVIIEPLTSFEMNEDVPMGRLQEEYSVESVPDHTGDAIPQVKVLTPGTAGPSPEEVFKASREEIDRRLPEERESRLDAQKQDLTDKKEEIRNRA